jgi:putative resolvase
VVTEVGSGLNGQRKGLISVLRAPEYGTVIVERRDGLTRCGSEFVEAALAASGRRLVVREPDETRDEWVEDTTEVLTDFCARIYRRGSAKRRAEKAIQAAAEP